MHFVPAFAVHFHAIPGQVYQPNTLSQATMFGVDITLFVSLLFIGVLAGFSAGLLGIGGGLLIVPSLAWILPRLLDPGQPVMHIAVASSLASMVFTSASSLWAHHRKNAIAWPLVSKLSVGIGAGTIVGVLFADSLNDSFLTLFFAGYALITGLHLLFSKSLISGGRSLSSLELGSAGGVVGFISSLLGIGGGSLIVPFLYYFRQPLTRAVASSAACGWPLAVIGSITYMAVGIDESIAIGPSIGYVYFPAVIGISLSSVLFAPIGAHCTHRLPTQVLKKCFAICLLLVGAKMLLS